MRLAGVLVHFWSHAERRSLRGRDRGEHPAAFNWCGAAVERVGRPRWQGPAAERRPHASSGPAEARRGGPASGRGGSRPCRREIATGSIAASQ